MSVNVLMIAEKPIVAQNIAAILSQNQMKRSFGRNDRGEYVHCLKIYKFDGKFRQKPARFKFISTLGHVMALDFPKKYKEDWKACEPIELFDHVIEKQEIKEEINMPDHLNSEAEDADYVILCLDNDREGENICFEVLKAIEESIRQLPLDEQRIFRLRFSSITKKEINQAMAKLDRPNINLSLSVDARQELDLRIGCAFTRFLTNYLHANFKIEGMRFSFGPCQTPALALCVDRYDEIKNFKPQSMFDIQIILKRGNVELKPIWSVTDKKNVGRERAREALANVKQYKEAIVVEVIKEEKYRNKPLPLNTIELLKMASKYLGMSPLHAISIANVLYHGGYIGYPRTETTKFPEDFDLSVFVQEQAENVLWGQQAHQLLDGRILSPNGGGRNVGDHPPIMPTKVDSECAELKGDYARLYELIVRHFFASVSDGVTYFETTVKLTVGPEEFELKKKSFKNKGFTEYFYSDFVDDGYKFPDDLTVNERLPLLKDETKIVESQTQPPDYMTESELIDIMFKNKLGTDGSLPKHIDKLYYRAYATVTSHGRRIIPTQLGIALVHCCRKIDEAFVDPYLRADIERELNRIAEGTATKETVVKRIKEFYYEKMETFIERIDRVRELPTVSYQYLLNPEGQPQTICEVCRNYVQAQSKLKQLKNCTEQQAYELPCGTEQFCRSSCNQKCPLDDFELIFWYNGCRTNEEFEFCPLCYNNPTVLEIGKHQGCLDCLPSKCSHTLTGKLNKQCQVCSSSFGIVDVQPGIGGDWKILCQQCYAQGKTVEMFVMDGCLRLSTKNKQCPDCCASQMVAACYIPVSKISETTEERAAVATATPLLRNKIPRSRVCLT